MSHAIATIHALLAAVLTLASLAVAWRPADARTSIASRIAAIAAIGSAFLGASRLRVFEPTTRRATYFASHAAGAWLDRKMHFGLAACAFALALGAMSYAPPRSPRVTRTVASLAFAFACFAWLALVYVHARAPAAVLE
jgi:hypothetical protein